jgi:hypothetical protein
MTRKKIDRQDAKEFQVKKQGQNPLRASASPRDPSYLGVLAVNLYADTTFIVGNCPPRIGLLGVCSQFCSTDAYTLRKSIR